MPTALRPICEIELMLNMVPFPAGTA